MATKSKFPDKANDLEILPDAWERFERAVDTVIKSGHRQRPKADPKACPASRRRVRKVESQV
jgi:hypothetical protein